MKDTFITQYVFTHSGRFHLDEVFSYSLLTFLYSTKLIRTRDIEVLQEEVKNKNSILIDVGGSYNPSLQNFDHHMINDDLITTKKGPTCELSNIRQEIKKNIKDYLSKNGIYLSEIDSNKFIQKFRSLESKERELINIEQYKIAYLTKDIVKYLSFIQSEYQIIDPLSKIDSLIESPTLYFKEFYSLFEFRKYSSLGLVWKHYGREILREFLEQDIDDEGAERYEKELTKEIDDLWKVIDSDLIIKVDNLDNGIGYGSSLGNIIENYNTLDANDHTEQYEAFLEASEFLKGYFKRYLNKEIKELEDLNSIKSEYKE